MSPKKTLPPDDRREYFRIDDAIHLSYHQVPGEDLPERLERLEMGMTTDFTLMGGLLAISQHMAVHLHRLEGESPDVAACIKALDKKLEILGRVLLAQSDEFSDQPARWVNISAGGIAFNAAESVEPGTLLEIKMLLLPSMIGILAYGEVVECTREEERDSDYPYCLRMNFSHMREEDRDALIRHVLRRQGESLRRRREQEEE